MTAAKLDPALCRRFASRLAGATGDLGFKLWVVGVRDDLVTQLTAAADLAERQLTEERVREVVRAAFGDDPNRESKWPRVEEIAARVAKELAGGVVATDDDDESTECPVHVGSIHGGEAEELRKGVEALLGRHAGKIPRDRLIHLLDRVDARDSLGYLERRDKTPDVEIDRVARLLMCVWERVEGDPVNVSYVATFADMARAVVGDRSAVVGLSADDRVVAKMAADDAGLREIRPLLCALLNRLLGVTP